MGAENYYPFASENIFMTTGYDGIDMRSREDLKTEALRFATYVSTLLSSLVSEGFTREEAMKIILECCVFDGD